MLLYFLCTYMILRSIFFNKNIFNFFLKKLKIAHHAPLHECYIFSASNCNIDLQSLSVTRQIS